MKRVYLIIGLSAGIILGGCDKPPPEPAPSQSTPAQPVPTGPVDITSSAPVVATVPPPGTAPVATSSDANLPPADPTGPLQNLVQGGNIFFYDDDGNFQAKDGVDFLQRAVRSYLDTQKYKSDDSPDWPPLNDLSLLVQYKIIRALPSPPPGQKYIINPQTMKVSMASN